MTVINPARGEDKICINGEDHKLCLTLGALAEIESALGGGSLEALQERLKSPRISDLLIILHALLRGGGAALTLEALKASNVDIGEAANAIANAFQVLSNSEEGQDLDGQ